VAAAPAPAPAAPTAWQDQAQWYDRRQGDGGDDFHSTLILPAVRRLLAVTPGGGRVLDVACGQGVLGRALAADGIASLGVDASPELIAAARRRAGGREHHLVGDVRDLPGVLAGNGLADERFVAAAVVMALADLDPMAPVLSGIARSLVPGGRCVLALSHPAFRIPRRSGWGWDDVQGMQYRRLDGYLSPLAVPIRTHPGVVDDHSRTLSFHRPLSAYLNACGAAGLGVIAAEELCSHRRGTKGARSAAEDRAAREFPLFLVLAAVALEDCHS